MKKRFETQLLNVNKGEARFFGGQIWSFTIKESTSVARRLEDGSPGVTTRRNTISIHISMHKGSSCNSSVKVICNMMVFHAVLHIRYMWFSKTKPKTNRVNLNSTFVDPKKGDVDFDRIERRLALQQNKTDVRQSTTRKAIFHSCSNKIVLGQVPNVSSLRRDSDLIRIEIIMMKIIIKIYIILIII